ncbi:hypothetical protein N7532_006913 [Penicillium argentinense]|uniref:Uncharacterized protein n=1 Tax=Penicillium argentinense TaxID=1131581 RepID=A0A9W9FGS6_9EURO|nr:uncharacterized protein N7532_006913 [Penicillium argentinense]KAJ5099912.1 hypothetical protein N7532_006913 [Penicillium argentinense]
MSELPGTASIVQRHVNPEVEKEFCFQTIYGVAEHICHQLLLSSDIPHFIESPAHDRHSLHKLPKNCHGTGSILQYPTPNNTGDQHSSSCDVRIILHYMRDQPKIKSLLQEAFKIENESRHPGILGSAQEKTNDRGASERDTPGSVSFYRVCVKKERLQMHLSAQAGTAITIQVRNILDDISARYEGRRQSSNALSVSEGQRIARFLYSGLEIVGSVEQELHEKEFRRNKKDNELLEESDKIANCFRKILGPKTGEARNIRSSSFEALASFLKLNGNNTRARLVTLIGSHNLNIPDEIQQEYQHMDFNIVLYLIDQELLGHETPSAPKESAEQVRIIMSTILWLNLLFPLEHGRKGSSNNTLITISNDISPGWVPIANAASWRRVMTGGATTISSHWTFFGNCSIHMRSDQFNWDSAWPAMAC